MNGTHVKTENYTTNYVKCKRLLAFREYSKATIDNYTRGIRRLGEHEIPGGNVLNEHLDDYYFLINSNGY